MRDVNTYNSVVANLHGSDSWLNIVAGIAVVVVSNELAIDVAHGEFLWDFIEKACNIQGEKNRLYLVENRRDSEAWKLHCMKRLRKRETNFETTLDMCMYGMRDPKS